LDLLKIHFIQGVVDVRSSPYSKYVPQFNKDNLQKILIKNNIGYYYAGDRLGGRPKDPSCYFSEQIPNGHVDYLHEVNYPMVATKEWFIEGLSELISLAQEKRIAVMCSEENPFQCHRHHLISQNLLAKGFDVQHIRGNGLLDPAMQPIVENKIEQLTLF
jgi:uncharacterized protein (DUF488 family)